MITLDPKSLAEHLGIVVDDLAQDMYEVRTEFTLRRRGVETKIIAGPMAPKPDHTLIAALARAHRWMGKIRAGTSIAALADTEQRSAAFIRTRLRPAFLAPTLQKAILDGLQSPELTLERILQGNLPLDWTAQEKLFGMAAQR